MLMPFLMPASKLRLKFVASAKSSTNSTSYSFTGVALGSAQYVIVGISVRCGSSFTTGAVTIGGVTATKIYETAPVLSNSGYVTVGFWIARVTTATGTISVAYDKTIVRIGVGVWAADGLSSTTAVDTKSGTGSSTVSADVSGATGGCVLSMAFFGASGAHRMTAASTSNLGAAGTVGVSLAPGVPAVWDSPMIEDLEDALESESSAVIAVLASIALR